ncbi:MAG: ATPase, partial [Angustibacter sp.]
MTGEPFADIPAWPHISAVVREDATAEVTVNGTPHPIQADSVDSARAALLDLVRQQTAVPLGRAVRVHTKDPHGQWQLIVHPNGDVDDASAPPQILEAPTPTVDPAPGDSPAVDSPVGAADPAAESPSIQLPRFPE